VSRKIFCVALATTALILTAASPAEAKKKKKPDLFDECPVSETIVVPSNASIENLQSLRGCEDVDVREADPEDFKQPAPVRIRAAREERGLDFENAPSSDDFGQTGKKTAFTDASKFGKGGKKKSVLNVGQTVTGLNYVRITPLEDEKEYAPLPSFGETPMPAAPTVIAQAANTASFQKTSLSNLNGDAILKMKPVKYATRFDQLISDTAVRHRIDPLLLHAVIKQESAYKQFARSHVGAQGLMQIMPGTGAMLGVRREHLNDPATNVDAGARLLRKLAIQYNGNFDLVLAAYNAGPGAVAKYGNRIPPYRETQDYVKKVMGYYYDLLNDNVEGGISR
jgi:hypothetical protein